MLLNVLDVAIHFIKQTTTSRNTGRLKSLFQDYGISSYFDDNRIVPAKATVAIRWVILLYYLNSVTLDILVNHAARLHQWSSHHPKTPISVMLSKSGHSIALTKPSRTKSSHSCTFIFPRLVNMELKDSKQGKWDCVNFPEPRTH